MIRSIKGFKDILPKETKIWQRVVMTAVDLFHDFGYDEICTPIMEKAALFSRSVGIETDIVQKEMYTLVDKKGDVLTLRPEATSSIVRAFIQNKMYTNDLVKRLYTIGPMFRCERPQKGRFRQFYQIDCEVFGISESYIDAEMIFMLCKLLEKLSIKNISVFLNSLGCLCCRSNFKNYLLRKISSCSGSLCVDCNSRKNNNPLRILDCKIDSCRESVSDIKSMIDFLCFDCRKHFDNLVKLLDDLKVTFYINKNLVRGLDYYNRTVFEIHHGNLGAQSAIAGGGRYDGLVKLLGGPDVPAAGFAIGFDRLVELVDYYCNFLLSPILFIIPLGEKALNLSFKWKMFFSSEGIKTEIGNHKKSLKSQLRQADRFKSNYSIILGEQEIESNRVLFKNMLTGKQSYIFIDNVLEKIEKEVYNTCF